MIEKVYPQKLQKGDMVRVVAPSQSFGIISKENREIAKRRFDKMGLKVTFGKHIEEMDEFSSSSIESRVEDLHEAFSDKEVKMIITVIGGFNCNQLLKYLDYDLIRNNPKIFIGYSDTTALENAIFAKTGLVTYTGPAYSTFAQEKYFDYTMDAFKQVVFSEDQYQIIQSENWSNDVWFMDQEDRVLIPNDGWLVINDGKAKGEIVGGNLDTFNLLQGTEFSPVFKNTILFLEDDSETRDSIFDRHIQALIHRSDFVEVTGVVIGRFEKASNMTNEKILKIIKTKKELNSIPVVANVDFGHTSPLVTFPIGGEVSIDVNNKKSSILITRH
ncbi:MAG: LD-carboxypeptidase [Candidatus Pacebacteria bacterium]|nr:LD-carboxypeptidase [Candidatus Paceibacterota bacterium]